MCFLLIIYVYEQPRIYQNLLEFVEAMSKGQWYTPFSHNWTLVMASLSPVLLRVETQQCLVWPQPWLSTPPPLIWKPQFCTTTSPL